MKKNLIIDKLKEARHAIYDAAELYGAPASYHQLSSELADLIEKLEKEDSMCNIIDMITNPDYAAIIDLPPGYEQKSN